MELYHCHHHHPHHHQRHTTWTRTHHPSLLRLELSQKFGSQKFGSQKFSSKQQQQTGTVLFQ